MSESSRKMWLLEIALIANQHVRREETKHQKEDQKQPPPIGSLIDVRV